MNTLHDLSNAEYLERFKAPLDMLEVSRLALLGKVYKLEIDCHGAPYRWTGCATSESSATCKAMADLSDSHPDFNRYKARVTACIQVAS